MRNIIVLLFFLLTLLPASTVPKQSQSKRAPASACFVFSFFFVHSVQTNKSWTASDVDDVIPSPGIAPNAAVLQRELAFKTIGDRKFEGNYTFPDNIYIIKLYTREGFHFVVAQRYKVGTTYTFAILYDPLEVALTHVDVREIFTLSRESATW